jgi:hypothetical protein
MKYTLFLFSILLIAIILPYFLLSKQNQVVPFSEGFEGYTLEEIQSNFNAPSNNLLPDINSEQGNDILLQGDYPRTNRNGISNNGADKIWWHYPIFKVGSYAQITNNIRYPNNPDEGTCMPASMCGALYKDKKHKTNTVKPLPPLNPDCGTRIGYFNSDVNLLPFRTDVPNILY